MNLQMDRSVGTGYSSRSQISRRVSEDWAARNLFCLACPSAYLSFDPPNTPVRDYSCPVCGAGYQLKSQGRRFGRSVTNSAYGRKLEAIREGRVPHYVFLQYDSSDWSVTNLFVVPSHFITLAVIEQRPPLSEQARRRGWIGSKILLRELPTEGQVSVVDRRVVRTTVQVRSDWQRFDFLAADARAGGGWGAEILTCVRRLQRDTGESEFTLQDFYARFTDELSLRHPENNNVEAKIRQQLQVLRDGNVLEFLDRGRYRVIG